MTDKQHLRTCELHRLQHHDMSWWRSNYWKRLELHTLEVLQTPSVGEVCEYPKVSSFLNSCLVLELVYVLASCSIKKMRGVTMVTTLSLQQQDTMVSTLNVLLLALNKAMPRGRLRITRFVLMPISVWIKLNHASCFLYLFSHVLVWMCSAQHIYRPFKLSTVLRLKCLLQLNETWS